MDKKYSLPKEDSHHAAEPKPAYGTLLSENDVQAAMPVVTDELDESLSQLDTAPSLPGGLSVAAVAHIELQLVENCRGKSFDELWEEAAPVEDVRKRLLANISV